MKIIFKIENKKPIKVKVTPKNVHYIEAMYYAGKIFELNKCMIVNNEYNEQMKKFALRLKSYFCLGQFNLIGIEIKLTRSERIVLGQRILFGDFRHIEIKEEL